MIVEIEDAVHSIVKTEQQVNKAFITANTIPTTLKELKEVHHIPSFVKDNEAVISQLDFITTTAEMVADVFKSETVLAPEIRLSHPIKGRIPSAKHKRADQLEEWEKTIYYERMAFVIEIPTISEDINGNKLSLTLGGVKAYNLDNLYSMSGADQHFKLFIGFQNKVCTNLCISTDGYFSDLKVKNLSQLSNSVELLLQSYNAIEHLKQMETLNNYNLTEHQFAQLIGRCRMYQHLPKQLKAELEGESLTLTDTQIGAVVKDYYHDHNFSVNNLASISLWNLFNLFTGVNKTSYIDSFLDRSVNSYQFVNRLKSGFEEKHKCWFLS
jgi:hypothetical protein